MISKAIKLIILTIIIGIISCDELKSADGESELMGVCIVSINLLKDFLLNFRIKLIANIFRFIVMVHAILLLQ